MVQEGERHGVFPRVLVFEILSLRRAKRAEEWRSGKAEDRSDDELELRRRKRLERMG